MEVDMKVGIVGSRDMSKGLEKKVREYVEGLGLEEEIVSGGARGVDKLGEKIAREERGMKTKVFWAEWEKYGRKSAGMIRNRELVKYCDRMVIFWDGVSKGSKNVIELCKAMGKEYMVVLEEEEVVVESLWG